MRFRVLIFLLILAVLLGASAVSGADGTGETCAARLEQDWTDSQPCEAAVYLPLVTMNGVTP